MSVWEQFHFPDFNSSMAARLFYYHDLALVVVVVISVLVLMFLISFVFSDVFIGESMHLKLKKCSWLELMWSIAPFFVLFSLGFVSMKNLYDMEVGEKVKFSVKVTGHQWYWEYSYVVNFSNTNNKSEFSDFVMWFLLSDLGSSSKEVFYSVFEGFFVMDSNTNSIISEEGVVSDEQGNSSGSVSSKGVSGGGVDKQINESITEPYVEKKTKILKCENSFGPKDEIDIDDVDTDNMISDYINYGIVVVLDYINFKMGGGSNNQSVKDYVVVSLEKGLTNSKNGSAESKSVSSSEVSHESVKPLVSSESKDLSSPVVSEDKGLDSSSVESELKIKGLSGSAVLSDKNLDEPLDESQVSGSSNVKVCNSPVESSLEAEIKDYSKNVPCAWDIMKECLDGVRNSLVVGEDYSSVLKGVSSLFLGGDWYYKYDSYLVSEDILSNGDFFGLKSGFRNQDVSVPCYLIRSEKNEVLISTADVMHSWGVAELGVKADAVPGRQNAVKVIPLHSGAAFGFCYELCGAGHSQMPICVFISNKPDVEWIIKTGVLETDAALDYLSSFS
uniref:Cytochrome c oxidase subunit 2 n=1 Tax=Meretrix lamarckii TaxID=157363 RepID=A0A0U1ZXU8_9BIVA|nr:cytochrome c oxidase subunit II [Meretrix lamarckii]